MDKGPREPDAQTLRSLRRGDEIAWEKFSRDVSPLLKSIVAWPKWRFTVDVREDLVAQVRSELPQCIANYRRESNLWSFIKRVCINRCIDRVRRQVRERAVMVPVAIGREGDERDMEFPAGDAFDPIREVANMERAALLEELLRGIDETCRKAIGLFYADGCSYKEIAGQLQITVNTVGSRLSKCLEKLRRLAQSHPFLGEELGSSFD